MRLALAAVAALALLAAACGGVESEPNLAKAIDRMTASGSSRIELRGQDGGENAYTCEGAADYARKRVRIFCKLESDFAVDMIALDGDVYTRFASGRDAEWEKREDDSDNPVGGFSPEQLLSMLREASSEIARVGDDEVRGTPAVRYRLTVDREKAELGDGPAGTADVDVWIDEDGLVRRIKIDETDGFTLDFFDFGVEVDIQAPPADQVLEAAPDIVPGPCTPGAERPFRIDQVRRTLRNHGFEVEDTEDGCVGGVAAILTNGTEGDRDHDELLRGPGYLTCLVLMRPNDGTSAISGGTSLPATGADPRMTVERSEANLECTLLADGPNAEKSSERLDQAYDQLKRATP